MIKIQNGEQNTKAMRIFINVFDHLGSLRVDVVGYGNSEQTYFDYKPFGKAKTRLGYVEMQETPHLF